MKRMSAAEYINAAGGFSGMEPPQSKYRNKPTVVDGIRFSSKAEAKRWDELRMLEKAGEIRDLTRQVAFPLHVEGSLIGRYVSDFRYYRDGQMVVEDVKGGGATQTPLFNWKAKHFRAQYGYDITIIGGKR